MSELIKDIHVSGLKYVGESVASNPPQNVSNYKRYSIPFNPNRHCLGYIEGPAASLTESTRNDRGYVTQLWRNVEESEDFQEGMRNATIVGELDHPEERVDYSLANGAVILTDWEIREDEGILWARFAILDNQRGKDLLAYVKFGTILGVSSRGLGDEIVRDGRTIIDPDTYEFYCFDVVAFPAAEVARQSFVSPEAIREAKSVPAAFADRVLSEASKCKNKQQLTNLQNVVESTSLSNKDKLIEAITDKLSSLPESTGDERTTSDEEAAKTILLSQHQADMKLKDDEIESLKAKIRKRNENAAYFRRVVQEQRKEIESLEDVAADGITANDTLAQDYENLKSNAETNEQTLRESHRVEVRKLQSRIAELSNKLRESKHANYELESKVSELGDLNTRYCTEGAKMRRDLKSASGTIQLLGEEIKKLESEKSDMQRKQSKRLEESQSVSSRKDSKIKSLQTEVASLKESIATESQKHSLTEQKLKDASNQLAINESNSKQLLDNYINKSAQLAGIDAESVKSMLKSKCDVSDVDELIEKLADKQRRFEKLPIQISPVTSRIVEHTQRERSTDNSFVVRALSQNK